MSLEDRTLTVVYGSDFVNVNFINFVCNSREVAAEWASEILSMAYNLLALNASANTFLAKAHAKILLLRDRENTIPVKNVLKMFAQHKDDKKRIEKALESCCLPSGKNESIPPDKFTYKVFSDFYLNLIHRPEITRIFNKL